MVSFCGRGVQLWPFLLPAGVCHHVHRLGPFSGRLGAAWPDGHRERVLASVVQLSVAFCPINIHDIDGEWWPILVPV